MTKDTLTNALLRLPGGVMRKLRLARYRAMGLDAPGPVWLQQIDLYRNPWDIRLEPRVSLDRGVVLLTTGARLPDGARRIIIRERVYCNRYTMFDASERIEIGPRTMIGPHCYITDHDHGIEIGTPIPEQPLLGAPVTIGADCWLGAGVTVLKGVTVGDGAILAAGAVVTKDIEPNAIAAGIPARVIKHRPVPAA